MPKNHEKRNLSGCHHTLALMEWRDLSLSPERSQKLFPAIPFESSARQLSNNYLESGSIYFD